MSMFYIDQREFKREVHGLIDSYAGKDNYKGLPEGVALLVDDHGIQIIKKKFADQILRLCLCNSPSRAKRLVNALDDRTLRTGWIKTIVVTALLVRIAFLIGIVWAAVALYHCTVTL